MRDLIDYWQTAERNRQIFEWDKWHRLIPRIQFPAHWYIKIIPPDTCAIIRFRVSIKELPDDDISVYLDCYDLLGVMGQPYWEAYPIDGVASRHLMYETDELLETIENEFKRLLNLKEKTDVKVKEETSTTGK